MGCLLMLVGCCYGRVILLVMWLCGCFASPHPVPWDGKLWPVMGFFFAPTTTLCYGACYFFSNGDFGTFWVLSMMFSIMLDFLGWVGTIAKATK